MAIDHFRRRRPHAPLSAAEHIPGGTTPEEEHERRAYLERLASLLQGLPDRESDLIALKYYRRLEGLKVATWLRHVLKADEGATFSLRDPLPFVLSIASLAHQTITRRWDRRLRRGRRAVRRWIQQLRPSTA